MSLIMSNECYNTYLFVLKYHLIDNLVIKKLYKSLSVYRKEFISPDFFFPLDMLKANKFRRSNK